MSGPAADRWQRLVRDRLDELERLSADAGPRHRGFWDARAARFAHQVAGTAARHPLLRRVRRHVGPRTTVLDVGAGPGRFALALAPRAREVVAVDRSAEMLAILREAAEHQGLSNVRTVHGAWEEVEDATGDVTLCVNVLPLVEDAATFLARLDAATRRRAFVVMAAGGTDVFIDVLWRRFHGRPRPPAPSYLDLLDVLAEIGVHAGVEVAETAVAGRWADLDDAVDDYRGTLRLPDTPDVRDELGRILGTWLARRADGLRPPLRTLPVAIVSWGPRR